MLPTRQPYRWFVLGDLNGFFGLIFDNLTVLSFLSGILIFAFGFPADIVFTRMFPGTALGVLVGDLIYTYMAFSLSKRTGNPNVTAMPLGLDTPSTIGLALVVLGPEFVRLKAQGNSEHDAAMMTWYVGMATMMYMGIIKLIFAFLGNWVQRLVPKAGLLGSLAGVGLGLIGMTALFDIFAMPLVGLVALGLIFYTVVAGIRLPGKIPGVFASVLIGTILYYILAPAGLVGGTYSPPPAWQIHFSSPAPTFAFVKGLSLALRYLPLSIPFALLTVVGGINVTASAKAAGDDYNTCAILLVEAFATLLAGMCGGVAQTTPYIGQPAYKNMGSRAGYTLLTGLVVGAGGMLGLASYFVELVPRAVLAPILVFVALDIVVQSFHAVPKEHAPAVALSFFPTIARLLGIKLGDSSIVPVEAFNKLMVAPGKALPEMQVIVALGNGFIVTGMFWAAFLVEIIDRRLKKASTYLLILAALTFFGIIHSAQGDGSMYLPWKLPQPGRQVPYQFTAAYIVLAIIFFGLSFHKTSREPAVEEAFQAVGSEQIGK
jgi:AGZA family xanthine/uracil permease-like MFS transporter